MNHIPDSVYINRALNGSVGDFEHLVTRYEDRLYRFLLARTGQAADAEDALQDTFIAAYTYLSSYRDKYCFSTWLYTIAVRKLGKNQSVRARGPLLMSDTDLLTETDVLKSDTAESTPHAALTADRLQLWLQIKHCLNETQFDLIWLFYVESLSVQELATALGRSTSWVKINLHRARQKLSSEQALKPLLRGEPVSQSRTDTEVTVTAEVTTIEESS